MITPEQIRQKLARYWQSGRLLREWLRGEEPWPLAVPFRGPPAARMLEDFGAVRHWIQVLEQAAKPRRGYGYRIEYAERDLRKLGKQRIPARIWIDSREDLLRLLGRKSEFGRFAQLSQNTPARFPALGAWLEQRPLKALEAYAEWPQLLAVCAWFEAHPRPKRYLRELDIPSVDSKFIENHQGLLAELLDRVLPQTAIDTSPPPAPRHRFAHRYGLNYEQPGIRLRLLSDDLRSWFRGLSDMRVPLTDFRRLEPPCRTIFITENKTNGLSFPDRADGLVIFRLGYGLGVLKNIAWLDDKRIVYWGDIDTHGFWMLSQLRGYHPQTQSLLMNETILCAYRTLAVEEPRDSRNTGLPANLTKSEQSAFYALLENRYGYHLRLEQERLPFAELEHALAESELV
jgi:hypothetical protein